MHKPRDSSLGNVLGWVAVMGGILWFGLGLANVWQGQLPDGIEGLLFGGLACVAGCVILYRRKRMNKREEKNGSA